MYRFCSNYQPFQKDPTMFYNSLFTQNIVSNLTNEMKLVWPAHDQTLILFSYALLLIGIKFSIKCLSLFKLVAGVLKPQLVWRAGRSAEALRTAAVGCVVAALNLYACPHSLAESLVPLLLSLLEDPAFKTRQFATLSLLNIVKSLRAESSLNAEDISQIFVGR